MQVFKSGPSSARTTTRVLPALLAVAMGLPAAVSAKMPAVPDGHSSRTSVDWPGTYRGLVPSGSGTGYDTFVVLTDKGSRYTLVESIDHKGQREHFRSSGKFTWNKLGSSIQLSAKDDRREFRVGENELSIGQATLNKLLSYPGGRREELLIDPTRLKAEGGHVRFDGVWNMDHATQLGHRSLAADFNIDCRKREYTMNKIRYFEKTFLQGKLLDTVAEGGNEIPITREDVTMQKVMKDHCVK